jgi:catechol 2,3-dioxygenase-like lactoylglutathione lyase family enzyme
MPEKYVLERQSVAVWISTWDDRFWKEQVASRRRLVMGQCATHDNESMFVTGIDHVQIAAPKGCEPEARNFFGYLLGLEEIEKPEPLRSRGGCWFKAGSRQLHIGVEEQFRPARKAHPAFAVADINALFVRLTGAGVRCVWDDALGGARRFYANDPWGNRLELTEPTCLDSN